MPPHLLNAPFPFRQFSISRQLKVDAKDNYTIMVSSYCLEGDHFGVICVPKYDELSLLALLSCTMNGHDCFCLVNSKTQPVNHSFFSYSRQDRFKLPFICVFGELDNILDGCAIYRVDEIIDECYFTLRADRAVSSVNFRETPRGVLHMHPAHPELLFDSPVALPVGTQAKCMFISAGLNSTDKSKINFYLMAPRANVAFIRAFALQMLRGLEYCHSRTRTFHEDIKCENIFHKNRITADHLMCHRDALQVMRDMKVEIGDFGRAERIGFSGEEPASSDFKRLAWVLLITVNPRLFMGPFKEYVDNPFRFPFPAKDASQPPAKLPPIRPSCSHFDTSGTNSGSIDEFMDLVSALSEWSPGKTKISAFKFAEYLARTHPFFEPLNTRRRSQTPQPACEGFDVDAVASIDDQYGGFHPAPLSAFQHLLQHLNPENRNIAAKVRELLDTVQNSSLYELMQHAKYELFQKLLPLLQGAVIDAKCVFMMFQVAFQVMDLCCNMRHVLMQVSCGGSRPFFPAQTSFLQFLSKCAVGDCQALHLLPEHEAQSVQAKSRQHVINIVRKSIPYAALNDWAQCGGCYSDHKMRSMLTHNVVASIFRALSPDSKLWLSDEPGHSELLAYFVHLRAIIATADATTHVLEHSAEARLSLFREICLHATVEELQRNLLHE
jgi:serine/threonine protein kinase